MLAALCGTSLKANHLGQYFVYYTEVVSFVMHHISRLLTGYLGVLPRKVEITEFSEAGKLRALCQSCHFELLEESPRADL